MEVTAPTAHSVHDPGKLFGTSRHFVMSQTANTTRGRRKLLGRCGQLQPVLWFSRCTAVQLYNTISVAIWTEKKNRPIRA